MKCRDIQDKLLTDFLDNELSSSEKELLQAHMAGCSSCRELSASVHKVNAEILFADGADLPPERVWLNIRRNIEQKPLSLREKAMAWLEGLSFGFRPSFSYAGAVFTALLVVLVVAVPQGVRHLSAKADSEMALQLAYADDETVFVPDGEDVGQGTFVEYLW